MRLREDIVTNFKGVFVRLVRSGYMIDVFVDKKYKYNWVISYNRI